MKTMSVEKNESMKKRSIFSSEEKRNMGIYIIGIVLYKFGLEAFNGSIITLATNRYDQDAAEQKSVAHTFERVGLLLALNQASQCLGAILTASLIKHYPIRTILSIAIFIFGFFTAILIILDASTGGHFKPRYFNLTNRNDFSYYGNYKTDWILLIFSLSGISYGMVESIHRIIPRDLVGYHVQKLQKMDALVHVFYAISGSIGAFVTGLILIPRLGNNNAFIITPILFTASGMIWLSISSLKKSKTKRIEPSNRKALKSILRVFMSFGKSVYLGGQIIFTNRKYIWLFVCYSLTLYSHRYLEDGIAPQVARRYLGNSAWTEILVGGSNLGELLGSILAFFLSKSIESPIPWLRLNALFLLILWYIPYYNPAATTIKYAWIISSTFIPLSFTWAITDISLVAHIQSTMTRLESNEDQVSILGCVMSFLFSSYILIYAIANPLIGKYIDQVFKSTGTIRPALIYTIGVQFTIIMIIICLNTLIPPNAFKWNPIVNDNDEDESSSINETNQLDASDVLIS